MRGRLTGATRHTLDRFSICVVGIIHYVIHDPLFFLQHFIVKVFVMIVTIEGLLEDLLIQKLHVLLNRLAILVSPFAVSVGSIKVICIWWNEGTM